MLNKILKVTGDASVAKKIRKTSVLLLSGMNRTGLNIRCMS